MTTLISRFRIALSRALAVGFRWPWLKSASLCAVIDSGRPRLAQAFVPGSRSMDAESDDLPGCGCTTMSGPGIGGLALATRWPSCQVFPYPSCRGFLTDRASPLRYGRTQDPRAMERGCPVRPGRSRLEDKAIQMTALISRRNVRRLSGSVALACALVASMAAADDTAERRQLAVWAVGLPSANFIMQYQAAVIQVTAEDVARGAVEVRGGSRLVVTVDSPTGYAVDFHSRGNVFQAIWVDGIGSAVELGAMGGTVVHREATTGRRVIALNYRFVLSPGTTPGTYAWPLDLVVRRAAAGDLQYLVGDRRHTTLSARTERDAARP